MSILDPAIAGCVIINNRPVTVVTNRLSNALIQNFVQIYIEKKC